MAGNLPRFDTNVPIVERNCPTLHMHVAWQKVINAIEALQKAASTQPDSTATTVAGVVADFNSFLAKLRTASLSD